MTILNYVSGSVFLLYGIYLSIFLGKPHFYAFFSIGAFLVLLKFYNSIAKKPLFNKWKLKQYSIFSAILILSCIIIDKLGLYLGYWVYPYFSTYFDEFIKYIFEWGVAFLYLMLSLMIGVEIFSKLKISKSVSVLLSLIIFVTIAGLFTEYINFFADSWKVLSMPMTNYKIGNYFLVFQTAGYWLMAIIPFIIYKFTDEIR